MNEGRSPRVNSDEWESTKYDTMRCIYCLLKEEGLSNRYWEDYDLAEFAKIYKEVLNDNGEELLMITPKTLHEPISIQNMTNKAYMTFIPISFNATIMQESGAKNDVDPDTTRKMVINDQKIGLFTTKILWSLILVSLKV